jgi:anti-sigma regulatory factor (Ser/Thr protein kinase)
MKLAPGKSVKMTVFSVPAHLPIVRAALEKVCELAGFEENCIGRIVLSVDEAMSNIIKHAYQGAPDQPIDVELTPMGAEAIDSLKICLRDYGRRVDRARIKSRDLANIRPGGLGVHIMSQCMDSLEYSDAPGGGTLLMMVKKVIA